MVGREPVDVLVWALGLSVGVHLAGGLGVPGAARPGATEEPTFLEIALEEPEPSPEEPPTAVAPTSEERAGPTPPEPRGEPRHRPRLRPRDPLDVAPETPPGPPVDESPVAEPPPAPRPPRPMPSLDPRAVALGGFALPETDPAGSRDPGPDRGAALGEALSEALAAEANSPPYARRRRAPPRLVPTLDGGYRYRGAAFGARIASDGSVTFSDRPGVTYDGFGRGGWPASFTFDLMDGAERRRGNDPYFAERRWFMEQTLEVRERLAETARAASEVQALRRLRGRLLRIWEDPALSREERLRRIEAIAEGFADDPAGVAAAEVVDAFLVEVGAR